MHVAPGGDFPPNTAKYYCQPFYVATPFFSRDVKKAVAPGRDPYKFAAPTGSAGRPPTLPVTEKPDDPFIIREITEVNGAKVSVAVFGLMDPDLQGTIGRLNYGWWNGQKDYETTAQISGLTDGFNQAMMLCDIHPVCKEPATHDFARADAGGKSHTVRGQYQTCVRPSISFH